MHMQNHMILHFKRSRASPSVSQGKWASLIKYVVTNYNISFNFLTFFNYYKY